MTTIYYNISADPIAIAVARIVEKLTTERHPRVAADTFFIEPSKVRHFKRFTTSVSVLNMAWQTGSKQDAIKAFLKQGL